MNFYSNTRPKLFNLKIDKDLSKIVCKEDLYPIVHDKITDTLILVLKNHIKPNWILILIVTIILLLLHYRYINKTGHYEDDIDNDLDELINEQINVQPTYNQPTYNQPIQPPRVQDVIYNQQPTLETKQTHPTNNLYESMMNHTDTVLSDDSFSNVDMYDNQNNLETTIVPPYAE